MRAREDLSCKSQQVNKMATGSTEQAERHSSAAAQASGCIHHHHHHHMVHRSSTGQLMDDTRQRQREERERWLSRWANIWTKRQSPEWKPRRASVASCQRQHLYYNQNTAATTNNHHQHDLELIVGECAANHIDLRKFLSHKIQQSRSQLKTRQDCAVSQQARDHSGASHDRLGKQISMPPPAAEAAPQPDGVETKLTTTTATTTMVAASVAPAQSANTICSRSQDVRTQWPDAGFHDRRKLSLQPQTLNQLAHSISDKTNDLVPPVSASHQAHLPRQQRKPSIPNEQRQHQLVHSRSALDTYLPRASESSNEPEQFATCCPSAALQPTSDGELAGRPASNDEPRPVDRTVAEAVDAAAVASREEEEAAVAIEGVSVGLNEELDLQDKQRKRLILSMALRQMSGSTSGGDSKLSQAYDECTRDSIQSSCLASQTLSDRIWQQQQQQRCSSTRTGESLAKQTATATQQGGSSKPLARSVARKTVSSGSRPAAAAAGEPLGIAPLTCCHESDRNKGDSVNWNGYQDNNAGLANNELQSVGDRVSPDQQQHHLVKPQISNIVIEATSEHELAPENANCDNGDQEPEANKMSIIVRNCDQQQQRHQLQMSTKHEDDSNNAKSNQASETLQELCQRQTTRGIESQHIYLEAGGEEKGGARRRLSSGLGADSSIHSTGSGDLEPNLSEFESDEHDENEQITAAASCCSDQDQDQHDQRSAAREEAGSATNNTIGVRTRRYHCDQAQPKRQSEPLVPKCDELDFEALVVESWLDDHPSFVHDYFMRKANRQLIDDWLIGRAKAVSTNLQFASSFEHLRQPPPLNHLVRGDSDSAASSMRVRHYSASNQCAATPTLVEGQSLLSSSTRSGSYSRMGAGTRSSSSQSGQATPVRKISATDFESRTGSGFLRPMVSTTPDGRPTFLTATCGQFDYTDDDLGHSAITADTEGSGTRDESGRGFRKQPVDGGNELVSDSETLERRNSADSEDPSSTCDEMPNDREMKLIFELVKNICNDLDIETLLHKILKNIAVLINADKSSLFLVCGEPGDPNRRLVSQLFNVDQDSDFNGGDSITIPWGTGLVGYVAESGESVNINNCYEDPRFTNTIDQRTGYVTKHMLCAPIFDKRNEIVGVAQVINKRDGNPFSKSDEIKFKRYLQFCGIGLRNAQSYENCKLENRRNQVLLDLARMVFEEQSTIEQVVYRIMLHTQSLLECQRCQVLLIDDGSNDLDHLLQLPLNGSAPASSGASRSATSGTETGSELQKPEWRPQCGAKAGSDVSAANQDEMSTRRCHRQFAEDNNDNINSSSNDNETCPSHDDDDDDDDKSGDTREKSSRRLDGCAIATTMAERSFVCEQRQQQQEQSTTTADKQSTKLFSLVFDLECDGNDLVMHSNKDELAEGRQPCAGPPMPASRPAAVASSGQKFPINIGITGHVAMTGETLNIEDAHLNERFDPSVDEGTGFRHKSILCMPIRNGQRQIIGVSQLINKKNGRPFNKNDEDLFEAFAIFCGLGIHNTLMYEKVLKIMAKQRVTFEVLSYHATAPLEEAKKLNLEPIPSCYALNLTSLKFNDFSLDEQFMLKSCLRFFLDLDLIRRFQIDQLVFCNWILSVQKNYRKVTYHPIVGGTGLKASPVRYHNWRHAFNVSQMMFAILVNTQICQALGELETLALLIACLCHDLDHRGTNNSFQIKSASPLAELYSTSTMEHHHFDQCVMILNSQGNQILANLSPEEYSRVIVLLEEAILATDLANYFQKRETFFRLVNSNQFEWQHNPEHRSLLRCMLMTACDVAAITKPWPVQKVVADLVMSEFYQQGDIEKQELNIQPIDMMNRDKMSELPEMQIGFIDSICAPIYAAFARLFPHELGSLLDGCLSNRNLWTEIAKSNNNNNNSQASKLDDNQHLCSKNNNTGSNATT